MGSGARFFAGCRIGLMVATTSTALMCLGASCDGGKGDGRTGGSPPRATSDGPDTERIEELAQVDVSELTRGERRTWVALVNEELSPCGEPVSVARCVAEERSCRRCVPAARYLARLVAEGYERSQITEHYGLRYGTEQEVELPIDHAPVRGAPMAPVTIIEFSDFECPHCRAAAPMLHRLVQEFSGRVKLAFLHYPLDGHENAGPAARAAVAAGNQGKFWEMHDLLFENQRALGPEDLESYAERLELDMARFRRDFAAEETQQRVDADKAAGRSVDVQGTPTLFVNGRRFSEQPEALPAYVREELDQ